MKKSTFFSFLLVFTIFKSIAQQGFDQGSSGLMNTMRFYNMDANTYNVLEGSPYIPTEGFREGSVLPTGANAKWFVGYKLRLNTYSTHKRFQDR
jgi:hypothetical protein